MALKTLIPFPIFAPSSNPTHHQRSSTTEVHFSRWNNANAQKFIRHERTQKEIEDELRRLRRFDSAEKIANIYNDAANSAANFKSTGTPSAPSRPSIPGKSSKYSKRNPKNPKSPIDPHPAFRRIWRVSKDPNGAPKAETDVKVGENGISYVVPDAPFEFQYSYTETPKEKPIKLREPPIAPFGPSTMPRPWTGRKPLAPSKKKIEFDSFQLPPPHKKGVKPVQAPGPFLPGSGPKYVKSREEILGEPLSKEEIEELIRGCKKARRQLNMGRDGLTHNMLDNIHALWKRRRVCKMKCKGVCTVDMDNVRQQLEEKTGGKIIYSKGGVIYLFRGRNYNYRNRPWFPLMLWKPVTPVYPRLIQRAPEGLTLEEANDMRKKGRILTPICKLGKNGVYCDLVKNVREAFEACELVSINCEGMNGSDFRKIGAKLKDLVPCVLISFEREHILMWRGRDWKSSLPVDKNVLTDGRKSKTAVASSVTQPEESTETPPPIGSSDFLVEDARVATPGEMNVSESIEDKGIERDEDVSTKRGEDDESEVYDLQAPAIPAVPTTKNTDGNDSEALCYSEELPEIHESQTIVDDEGCDDDETSVMTVGYGSELDSNSNLGDQSGDVNQAPERPPELSSPCLDGVVVLLKQAVETGSAVVLDDSSLDADIVYQRAVALSQSAPSGPVFRHHRPRKAVVQRCEKQSTEDQKYGKGETEDVEVIKALTVPEKREGEKRSSRNQKLNDFGEDFVDVVSKGSLRVDELAKLLS